MAMRRRRDRPVTVHPHTTDRRLRAQLFDDERVVMVARPSRLVTLPKTIATLGLYALWRRRDTSVVTDQRVLVGRGVVRRSERSIPLGNVHDVSFTRRGFSSYADITIDEHGRSAVKRIGPMGPGTAHRFAREILRRM